VTDDWAAVADAINQRKAELDLSQRELIDRSQLSKGIVGELQNNKAQRRRSPRTLEALSLALDWHPNHLAAVLAGRTPPRVGDPVPRSDDDVPGRLTVIEHYLQQLLNRADRTEDLLSEIVGNIETTKKGIGPDGKQSWR
jgi:hypothetical protein